MRPRRRITSTKIAARETTIDPAQLAEIRATALRKPALVGPVVSADGQASIINIAVTLPDDNANANAEVVDFVSRAAQPLRAKYPKNEINIGNTTATDVVLGEAIVGDIMSLVGFSYLVIIGGL